MDNSDSGSLNPSTVRRRLGMVNEGKEFKKDSWLLSGHVSIILPVRLCFDTDSSLVFAVCRWPSLSSYLPYQRTTTTNASKAA